MFLQYIREFTHYLRFEKRSSALTITAYEADLKQFSDFLSVQFLSVPLSGITHFHLRSWLAGLKESGMKERSINRKISSINGYYRFLISQGKLQKNRSASYML